MKSEFLAVRSIKFSGHKIDLEINQKGKPVARLSKFMTMGKNKGGYKLIQGFYFPAEERREEWIKEQMDNVKTRENIKEQHKKELQEVKKNFINPFKFGDIYFDSWGYDQTNIDFYQIIEVKEKSVVIQRIGKEYVPGTQGMDCSNVIPNPEYKIGEPVNKIIQIRLTNDGSVACHLHSEHGWISKYERGEKGIYSSWYH